MEYADDASEEYTYGEQFDTLVSDNLDGLDTFIKSQYGYCSSWESYGGISAENEFCELNKKRDLSEYLKLDSLKTNGTVGDMRRLQDINQSNQTSSGFEDWQEKVLTDNSDINEYLNTVPSVLFSRKQKLKLPSWIQLLAWFLMLTLLGISTYITIVYVYRFGNQYFNNWLQSLFYSILCSNFILHPLWVGVLAFSTSVKSWSPGNVHILSHFDSSLLEELSRVDYQFKMSEEVYESEDEKLMKRQRARYLRYLRPPPESTLIQARIKALKTKHIVGTVKSISASLVMFVLLLIMAFGKDTSHNYYQKVSIENAFVRTGRFPATSVKSHSDWWQWVRYDFLDSIYGTAAGDGAISNDPYAGILFSTGSIAVVYPVVHLYSDAPQTCFLLTKYLHPNECSPSSSKDDDDEKETVNESDQNIFQGKHGYYRRNSQSMFLGTTRKNAYEHLKQLYDKNWLDNKTRGIVVEFLLYNPTTAIFTSVTITAEFPAAGGAINSISILPRQLHQHNTLILMSQFIFQILILWVLKKELWKIWKTGRLYWNSPWRFLKISFCSLSLSYAACTIFRTILVTSALHKQEQASHLFHSCVKDIAKWDQVLNGQLGLLIFIHMIGSLEFLRTSNRIRQFLQIFNSAQRDIIILLGFFIIILINFAHVANLAFGSDEFIMKNPMLQALQMMRLVLRHTPSSPYSRNQSMLANLYTLATLFGILGVIMMGLAMMKAVIIRSKRDNTPKKEVSIGMHEIKQLLQEKIIQSLGVSRKRDLQYREISIPPAELLLMELETLVDEVFTYANKLFADNSAIDAIPNNDDKEDEKKPNNEKNIVERSCCSDASNSHQVTAELHYCSPAQVSCDHGSVYSKNEEIDLMRDKDDYTPSKKISI